MKILVIKTSSLGDVVHALPAVTDAVNALPNLEIDWVVEEAFVDIPRLHKAVKRVIPIAWRRWRANILQKQIIKEIKTFLHNIRAERYDYIIDAQGLLKSAVLGLLAHGARCGFDKDSVREPWAAYCYQRKYSVAKDLHAITRLRQLFAAIFNYPMPSGTPDYGIDPTKIIEANSCENYLIFFHGTTRKDKCWAENKWVALAKIAVKAGYFVYLPWGNELEHKRAQAINQEVPASRVLPKMQLHALATFIVQAKGVVAVDTGLGHLAAALNIPTISLYGPTNPKLIGTWGSRQKHILNFTEADPETVWQELATLSLK